MLKVKKNGLTAQSKESFNIGAISETIMLSLNLVVYFPNIALDKKNSK